MNNKILKLKENIFYRARIFIEDAGYFVPFGAKICQNHLVDMMPYEDFEDSINGVVLVDLMKSHIINEFKKGLIQGGAIAYDVVINVDNEDGLEVKRDALCLIFTEDGKNWLDEYFPYILIDNECIWI